ncbi:cytochrome ubiquinol oxidase subunit I [Allonocardiopsis opalescens]|uniref:Cytochrome d ubiquinol oxidase subunit I n=1 Tax=Allonocardiopsis opalescens TaxID=1144618 RepID=A0A2T0QDM9_9ACTN|nr:cytochrome ubiquinol oxidase subunit I [Allonocardiopsis opalescens]PRY02008.1 cytochrome d ubiquinol oxidase subunit I [Allonocardiopsis opalescens]
MEALELARTQFAVTAGMHFLFVLLTLGLAPAVAILETRYAITRRPVLLRMTRFWGQVYVINYALGILTGLVMEFQFGIAWSGLAHFVGNVFGAPIALETLLAFFLESTFLALWIFGWHRFGVWTHCLLIWLVTLTAYMSAVWIMVANSFMQHPVGYEIRDGVGHLTDFGALVANQSTWYAIPHIVGAAALATGFLFVGAAAFHFLRRRELRRAVAKKRLAAAPPGVAADRDLFLRTMRFGVLLAAFGSFLAVSAGFARFSYVGAQQPMKMANFAHAEPGDVAAAQRLLTEQFGPGDYELSPMVATASMFMDLSGNLYFVIANMVMAPLLAFNTLARFRPVLALLVLLPPLPFLTAIAGWIYREMGRQPWVVYGELTVEQAVSPIDPATLTASLAGFTVLFGVLFCVNWTLILRTIGRGPDRVALGAPPPEAAPAPVPAATL